MSLNELKIALKKRNYLKSKLAGLEKFATDFRDNDDVNELKYRINEMTELKIEFRDVNFKIVEIDDETHEANEDVINDEFREIEEFDKRWYTVLSRMQSLVENSNLAKNNTIPRANTFQSNIKLPTINLPEFHGKYSEWLPFYDTFNSLIHENVALDNCQKLHYLKSCCKSEALKAIESLSTSAKNYEIAYQILQKRYQNSRLIIQEHVNAILNTPTISKSSETTLRSLLNDVNSNLESLRNLKIPVECWDAILLPIICRKLDYFTRKEFELTLTAEIPKLSDLLDFLDKKCLVLSSVNVRNDEKANVTKNGNYFNRSVHAVTKRNTSCHYCKGLHFINQCPEFAILSINERKQQIQKRNMCLNCLRDNHRTENCKSTACKTCGEKHHTLLHENRTIRDNTKNEVTVAHCAKSSSRLKQVILSTAQVLIKNSKGNFEKCRALLDPGSQLNLISADLCHNLNLKTKIDKISISGVNDQNSTIQKSVLINLKSAYNEYRVSLDCHIVDRVTENLPVSSFEINDLNLPKVDLADPEFNRSGPVHIILGAELSWKLMYSEKIEFLKINENDLYMHKTPLGYIVGGVILGTFLKRVSTSCNVITKNEKDSIKTLIEKFWVQEEIERPQSTSTTIEERACEEQFIKTHKRDENGRFVIKLPFKNDVVNLGDSSYNALERFLSFERKCQKKENEFLREEYAKSINESIKLNFMEYIPIDKLQNENSYYLPHSSIIKPSRTTTKVRIVYDGSAKSSNGLSLNDNLMTGQNLQNDLFELIVRFRTYRVAFCCDMEKMFLQIKIAESDKDYLRLFWRESKDDAVQTYRLTRLVFGLTNSPFTAMRCIRQLAVELQNEYPLASRVLTDDVYMDDVLSGTNTLEESLVLRDHLIKVLNRGCFKLAKWRSNNALFPTDDILNGEKIEIDKKSTKVLGLLWNPQNDSFGFKVEELKIPEKLTKRILLSQIAKLFDPIGIISPIIIKAKMIMQQLCLQKSGWDEPVSNSIRKSWLSYVKELEGLNKLEFSRKIVPPDSGQFELIAFCDASMKAYGASVYLRSKDEFGVYHCALICSKSKVAPIKTITLPRLELCAAVLAVTLLNKVHKAIRLQIERKFYFTDSTITLHYINSNSNSFQIYVANRISQIQTLSDPEEWYHVGSKDNPADLISRGTNPENLIASKLFWHGPFFLVESQNWIEKRFKITSDRSEVPEQRKHVVLTAVLIDDFPVILRVSSFAKLERIFAYCFRFTNNMKIANNKQTGNFSISELSHAHNVIIKIVQAREFPFEYDILKDGVKKVNKTSQLLALDIYMDEIGIIRIGGRLRNSSLPYNFKHPILLPKGHHITKLIIRATHVSLFHAGPTQTLAAIRSKYWPIRARDDVRKVIRSCLSCFKVAPKLLSQKMGDLPKDRLEPCKPFTKTGVDYFGPIMLKPSRRSKIRSKSWVALFVCMVTRAVHIEIVLDLTSESFINALKRLIARRGKITHIYSDNATTFVGAKRLINGDLTKYLREFSTDVDIQHFLSVERITWKFTPPNSPNFGGLWERLIRSAKQHIKRTAGNANLTNEEALTLFTQIEAILNSRPLTPISNDADDFEILTPAHFIIGESLTCPLERNLEDIPLTQSNRWRRIQELKEGFWNRWSSEVLCQLQPRQKWHTESDCGELKIGALVLLADPNLPPLVWKTGRIKKLIAGPDGLVRVAIVATPHGTYTRSIRKLALLPIAD